MRSLFLTTALLLSSLTSAEVAPKTIPLPTPSKAGGMPIQEAFAHRRTIRDLDKERSLDPQLLSNLLWSANGLSGPGGRRTAPTARNFLEYELYVVLPQGVYHYNTATNALDLVLDKNLVPMTKSFGSMEILLVANTKKQNNPKYIAIDAGFIGQNIYLFCAANGLGSVFRGVFPARELNEAIPLPEGSIITWTHSVGYLKNTPEAQ